MSSNIFPNHLIFVTSDLLFLFPLPTPPWLNTISLYFSFSNGRSHLAATIPTTLSTCFNTSFMFPTPATSSTHAMILSTYEGTLISMPVASDSCCSMFSRMGALQKKKTTGERGHSCGTLRLVVPFPLILPSHSIVKSLCLQDFDIQTLYLFPPSVSCTFRRTMSFSTFWKPPLTSRRPHRAFQPAHSHDWTLVTSQKTASITNLPLTLPNWCLWRSTACCSSSATTFSPSLPKQLMRVMGHHALRSARSRLGLEMNPTFEFWHSFWILPSIRLSTTSSISYLPKTDLLSHLMILYLMPSGPGAEVLEVLESASNTLSLSSSLPNPGTSSHLSSSSSSASLSCHSQRALLRASVLSSSSMTFLFGSLSVFILLFNPNGLFASLKTSHGSFILCSFRNLCQLFRFFSLIIHLSFTFSPFHFFRLIVLFFLLLSPFSPPPAAATFLTYLLSFLSHHPFDLSLIFMTI